jgi:hypothetical protein
MSTEEWGSDAWQDAHFPSDKLDSDGDTWGIRWRGMEKRRHNSYLDLIADRVKTGSQLSLLDIGCALCDFTRKLWEKNRANKIHGMDISPTAIEWGSKTFPDFDLRVGKLPDIPWDQQFDGILCLEVLCYLTPEERQTTIDNIAHRLLPDGWMMFSGVLDDGSRYHTEEEIDELMRKDFDIVAKSFNYWWLYRKVFEGPLDRARTKLDALDQMVVMPREEYDADNEGGGMRKLAGALRPVSFIAHPLLRLFSGSLKLVLSSETIAILFSKLAYLIGGRKRADEIIVVAEKKRS